MKRLFCLLLICVTVLLCGSCDKQDGDAGGTALGYSDPYLYTQIGGVLHRISPLSASVTPVCPDPLCRHADETCPLYGVENIQFDGQYLYYQKVNYALGEASSLCRYDLKNGEFQELYRAEDGSLFGFFAGEGYVFFNRTTVDEDGNNRYSVYRYDTASGKTVQLHDEPFETEQVCLLVKDGRVYWHGDTWYSTDPDFQNRRENDRGYSPNLTRDKYFYEMKSGEIKGYDGYKQMCFCIIRVDRETGERVTVTEDAASAPILYGDKVIYGKLETPRYLGKIQSGENGSWNEQYDKYGGKLYICNSDGTDERVLCDFSDTSYALTVSHNILGGKTGVGDWIAVMLFDYVSADDCDPEKIKRGDNVYMLINLKTGEWKVASIETRS